MAAFWVLSALVSGMPPPSPESSVAYVWLYSSFHILMANLNSIITRKAGQLPLSAPLDPPAPVTPAQPPVATVTIVEPTPEKPTTEKESV